jgi:hypothetical protein
MKNTFKNSYLLAPLLCVSALSAQASVVEWNFGDTAGTRLNQAVVSGSQPFGAATSWGTAITGVQTNGAGQLNVANDGLGGLLGTRSAYADFGPNFEQFNSGWLSLYASFSTWAPAALGTQSISLGFIEGNSFNTAAFTLSASSRGFDLSASVDADGDGEALPSSATWSQWQALTVRLDLNLDTLDYRLGYDLGNAGLQWLGSASLDSLTQGVNSLRFSVDGDFRANPLGVDRIWVQTLTVPEPSSAVLLLAALAIAATRIRRPGVTV